VGLEGECCVHISDCCVIGRCNFGLSQENSLCAQYFLDADMREEKFIPLLIGIMWITFLEGKDTDMGCLQSVI
jgi:hypothetical protein